MAKARIYLWLVSTIALLWLGPSLGALEAPVVPGPQTGSAAAPIWLAAGPDAAPLPETGTPRQAPDELAIASAGSAANPASLREPPAGASERPPLRVPPRLYLSHCAFLY